MSKERRDKLRAGRLAAARAWVRARAATARRAPPPEVARCPVAAANASANCSLAAVSAAAGDDLARFGVLWHRAGEPDCTCGRCTRPEGDR